jgi:hypothetical protein
MWKMSTDQKRFFSDVATSMKIWASTLANATANSEDELDWVDDQAPFRKIQVALSEAKISPEDMRLIFDEAFRGFAVSLLTILDGGSSLSQKGRIYVVNDAGDRLGEGLHEKFIDYLIDTDRLV